MLDLLIEIRGKSISKFDIICVAWELVLVPFMKEEIGYLEEAFGIIFGFHPSAFEVGCFCINTQIIHNSMFSMYLLIYS